MNNPLTKEQFDLVMTSIYRLNVLAMKKPSENYPSHTTFINTIKEARDRLNELKDLCKGDAS